MSRLIDADAFLERNKVFADRGFIHPIYEDTLREIVDEEPTIDAVPVVRCRECKYAYKSSVLPLVDCGNGKGLVDPRPDSFCSYGERKEDDHE